MNNKFLSLSKLQLSILISMVNLDPDNKGVTTRQLTTFFKDRTNQTEQDIYSSIKTLVKNNYMNKMDNFTYRLDPTGSKEIIQLFSELDTFIIDRLINMYIPLSSLRVYTLMRMVAFPRFKKALRISYREIMELYNSIWKCDLNEHDIYEFIKVLIEEGLIKKKTYETGNYYRYNEYSFIGLDDLLKDIGLID